MFLFQVKYTEQNQFLSHSVIFQIKKMDSEHLVLAQRIASPEQHLAFETLANLVFENNEKCVSCVSCVKICIHVLQNLFFF